MNEPQIPEIFKQYQEKGDWVIIIPWNQRQAGKIFTGLAVLAAITLPLIYYLDGRLVEISSWIEFTPILAILIYLANVCFRNQTILRIKPDASVHLSYGPLPLVPGTKFKPAELDYVKAYWEKGKRITSFFWRVDLAARNEKRYPLFIGGRDCENGAERLEQVLVNRLNIPTYETWRQQH